MMARRDPENEAFIRGLEEKERNLYLFIRNEYDKITNQVYSYEFDLHVINLASIVFNTSKAEVEVIYGEVEMKIADFHRKRIHTS
jgi:hypothetical protein